MHLRRLLVVLLLILQSRFASAMTQEERREFLDAIRPKAERMAGQPVRFRVYTLNYEGGWAVLVGHLMAPEGKKLDWSKAKACDPSLDKMLWVVAKKAGSGWHVEEMYICSPEPPYWNLDPEVAFSRPCGIYTGLGITGNETAEQRCRAHLARKRRVQQ